MGFLRGTFPFISSPEDPEKVALRTNQRRAYDRLQGARQSLAFQRDAMEGFPSDLQYEALLGAEDEFENAMAVAQEHGAPLC